MSFFIEDNFFFFSLLPFLHDFEKVKLLSISKSVFIQFDNDRVWHFVMPFMKEANSVLIKKSIHFRSLMYRYSIIDLLNEVQNKEQMDVIFLSLNYYPKGAVRSQLKMLIHSLVPDFLNTGYNYADKNIQVPYDLDTINMHLFIMQYCEHPFCRNLFVGDLREARFRHYLSDSEE